MITIKCNFNNKYTYFKFVNNFFEKNVYIRRDGLWLSWCDKNNFEKLKINEDSAFCSSEERKIDYVSEKTGKIKLTFISLHC